MSPVTEPRIGWQVVEKTYAPREEGGWLIGRRTIGEPHESCVEADRACREVVVTGRSVVRVECVRMNQESRRRKERDV